MIATEWPALVNSTRQPRAGPPAPDDDDVHDNYRTPGGAPAQLIAPLAAEVIRQPGRRRAVRDLVRFSDGLEGDKVGSVVVPGGTTDDLGKPAVEEVRPPSASPRSGDAGEARFSRQELGDVVILPESLSYRLKKALLGPPLVTERLSVERLGKPMALGVLSPDCISSTAYGSEEILFELVKAVGVAAFSLLLPITLAVIVVLLFVTLSYREVVMVYTRAGGSYVVARENFGVKVAQIAAVALIIDYIVTVAVQVAAGTDAVSSAFPSLGHWDVEISVAVVALMCYGNLRGIREAGRTSSLSRPTSSSPRPDP